jgi:RNA polymerase sigma-70 factor (ECF subfamily)
LKLSKKSITYELLVLRCQRRDPGALEELVRLFERRLFYYIRRLVDHEHDAWNILQETWLSVFTSIGSLRRPELLAVWLYGIARRRVIDYRRGKYADRLIFGNEDVMTAVPDDYGEIPCDDAGLVHRALQRLSTAHREVLTLYFLEEMPLEAIAAVVDASVGTVKSRLFYAKLNLRKLMENESEK